MMRITIEIVKVIALLVVLAVFYNQAAYAQTARKFADKPITVRLCPASCRAVNGHGLRPGGDVKVYESRGGWARVSAYLDRAALVPSFGNKITTKPALWVPVATLLSNKPVAQKSKEAARKKPPQTRRPVSVIDRIARLQRVPRPIFRPGEKADQPVQASVSETASEPVTTTVADIAVSEPVKKPVVVDTTPVTRVSKGEESKKTLTWEEVQAKIAAQAAGKTTSATSVTKSIEQSDKDKAAAEQAKAAEMAAEKAKSLKAAADAKAAEKAAAEDKVAADAKAEADAKMKLEEEAKAQAAQKAAEAAKQTETKKLAVVLPPKEVKPEATDATEPTFKSANADPITLGARPKKLTKQLLDKRLKNLPGSKSKTPKKVVIALRHYALGLLNSGECKGIEKGGASAVPGMLYVTCSDDPTYLRQFPLEEETW